MKATNPTPRSLFPRLSARTFRAFTRRAGKIVGRAAFQLGIAAVWAAAMELPVNGADPAVRLTAATNAPAGQRSTGNETLDDHHRLAIGDRLSFRIKEEDEEEPKALTVTDSGEVEVPYIGRLPAENRTCRQLAHAMKIELEKEYFYQATVVLAVDLMAKSRGRVYLVGPVRVPGPQEIPSDEPLTVSKAILRAGGFGDFADRHNVRLLRKGPAGKAEKGVLVVDVAAILERGRAELDPVLESGDLVLVAERLVRF
jgi:polysaccharide biosynthesis/export protein